MRATLITWRVSLNSLPCYPYVVAPPVEKYSFTTSHQFSWIQLQNELLQADCNTLFQLIHSVLHEKHWEDH